MGKDNVSSLRLLLVSIPAMVLNSAIPIATSVITAFCGRRGTDELASFSTVLSSFTFALAIFNFLTNVVTAQVGKSIGRKDWADVGKRVRMALLTPIALGLVCGIILMGAKSGVYWLLNADDEVRSIGNGFYYGRIAILPFQLMISAITGVLCGYQRLTAALVVNVICGGCDILGNYFVFNVFDASLTYSAVATGIADVLAVLVGIVLIVYFPPEGSNGEVHVFSKSKSETIHEDSKGIKSFLAGSLNTIVRSLVLQGAMFLLAIVAAQLGKDTLAAHQVILQLWMVASYVVDGLATTGNMMGSKFVGEENFKAFGILSKRLVLLGLGVGALCAIVILGLENTIMNLFVHKDAIGTRHYLKQTWFLVGAIQPINSLVFTYDGLLFAANSFAYVRNVLVSGFVLFVAPMLIATRVNFKSLLAIWIAKGMLNVWRLITSIYHVHISIPKKHKSEEESILSMIDPNDNTIDSGKGYQELP